jgi:hypothetical protein
MLVADDYQAELWCYKESYLQTLISVPKTSPP